MNRVLTSSWSWLAITFYRLSLGFLGRRENSTDVPSYQKADVADKIANLPNGVRSDRAQGVTDVTPSSRAQAAAQLKLTDVSLKIQAQAAAPLKKRSYARKLENSGPRRPQKEKRLLSSHLLCHNGLNQQKGPSMRMGIEIALSLLVILGIVALYRHTNPPTGKK
jgi:hypothetical protein